jgi:hypothetical protein
MLNFEFATTNRKNINETKRDEASSLISILGNTRPKDPGIHHFILHHLIFIMSAWERARYIPWSKIPQDPDNLEQQKERIFRELQRETTEQELLQQQQQGRTGAIQQQEHQQGDDSSSILQTNAINHNSNNTKNGHKHKLPFSGMELLRQAAFGGCIGSITGAVFGFMEGMRTAQESVVLKNASNMAKGKFLFQGTTRSATLFGIFFAGFHSTKYGIKVAANEPGHVAGAAIISTSALLYKPAWRPSMPYAIMLIAMDCIHVYMRKTT